MGHRCHSHVNIKRSVSGCQRVDGPNKATCIDILALEFEKNRNINDLFLQCRIQFAYLQLFDGTCKCN